MYFGNAYHRELSVTYISDLRLHAVTPIYERQFRPTYLLGLNELVRLAYVQNLGLLMK